MGYYDAKGQAAAQRAYDNACDCCDHGPREAAPDDLERELHSDAEREFAGIESATDWGAAIAHLQRLNRVLGADWAEGLPV